ncbi:protein of unknown function [Cardinium endosymbiont cEper1 of Encarsia pergandiella]|nr:protein of unknown function [Cardinium endosymbiont cEper1 of Encarsia pergandiella]
MLRKPVFFTFVGEILVNFLLFLAGVAELVDALDLGSSTEKCGGSSPSIRTIAVYVLVLKIRFYLIF